MPIRLFTIDDASLFVDIRRLSLCTDPESFSARPETDLVGDEIRASVMPMKL